MPVSLVFAVIRKIRHALRWGLLAAFLSAPLHAVIFYSTGDPNFNTTPPTGIFADSGWQWAGTWGGFQGTPISPHHFISARHVGGTVGEPFVLGGITYTTTASFDDPASDLRIWRVSGTFPSWAPLYRASDEVGQSFVVFGHGLPRGAEVRDVATNTLRGWQWGPVDGRLRWGRNAFVALVNGGTYWGTLLRANFDAEGGGLKAHLALGDSSGPIFIHDSTGWKLAGVAASVDSAFNTTTTGAGFSAAIFDARGLYFGNSTSWKLISGPAPVPSGFYATRVSAHTAWIDGVLASSPTVVAAPVKTLPESAATAKPAEEKRIVSARRTGRTLPPRFRMMRTLAALGNPQKQFQLGAALLQESDEAAKAEGFKWVDAAAAQGYGDAVVLLAKGRDQLVRPGTGS